MADNHSKEVRSMNMSHIRSKNSKPEELVRKYLFSKGFRYRKNVKTLPGCPDIVLPKYKTVIFVNGCFWHKHDCPRFVWPSTNEEYWRPKIMGNVERDKRNLAELQQLGWTVLIVMSVFGLQRGIPKKITKRKHTTLKEYNEQLKKENDILEAEKSKNEKRVKELIDERKHLADDILNDDFSIYNKGGHER